MNPALAQAARASVCRAKTKAKEGLRSGHNGFADGAGQPWLIYHAARSSSRLEPRDTHAAPFTGTSKACLCLAPPGAGRHHGQLRTDGDP